MRKILGLLAGLAALSGAAAAAPVTFMAKFYDQSGGYLGNAVFTYDLSVVESLYVYGASSGQADQPGAAYAAGGRPCYAGIDDLTTCDYLWDLTPVTFSGGSFDFNGRYSLSGVYLDGYVNCAHGCYYGRNAPGDTTIVINADYDTSSTFWLGFTPGISTGQWLDDYDYSTGTVQYFETPLPAAAWVFLAGLSGLGLYRRQAGHPNPRA